MELKQKTEKALKAGGIPKVFGIRHLSPAGAYYLREYLDQEKPELVLIEGPSDFTGLIGELGGEEVKPPVAVMSYTLTLPIRTLLYPFAIYSPEYQAICWAREHGCPCRFCDLPSEIFLGFAEQRAIERAKAVEEGKDEQERREPPIALVYQKLDELSEDGDSETFWERTLEQAADANGYRKGAIQFGTSLRSLSMGQGVAGQSPVGQDEEDRENLVREAYMCRIAGMAIKEGMNPEKIVMVTGSFHVEGILQGMKAIAGGKETMTDKQLARLPRLEAKKTLMPYSYYRLSERSGYGAGNRAPAYYEMIWDGLCRKEADYAGRRYLASLAAFQREQGNMVSSAEIIEAGRLSYALARLHGGQIPALQDLRDGALTCMGHGRFGEIALAVADTEIGTKIGRLPEGVSQTSVQSDFYYQLKELRLEKYKSVSAQQLSLDLRENLRVKSPKAAFIDLERSFFLHRLRVLGISFAQIQAMQQERATWAEQWLLRWTPEAEMQIVEAVLKGDTIEQAVAFELKERIAASQGIAGLAEIIEESCRCGMPVVLEQAVTTLQKTAVDAVSVTEIAETAGRLSMVLQYGDIRRLDRKPLIPILSQLFLRACLILAGECVCDDQAAKLLAQAMSTLHQVSVSHDFLDSGRWLSVLGEIAGRDDLNTRLSGLAAAILLEAGKMDSEELGREVQRRLSRGIPAELGAGWFEGLSMKNHYALIARLSLWERLSEYLDVLDDEEFKRALVFLRRAFADFSAEEKDQIAENLGEIWQVNPTQVSEVLNGPVSEEEMGLLEGLEDFDFGDI